MIKNIRAQFFLMVKKKEFLISMIIMILFVCYSYITNVIDNRGVDIEQITSAPFHTVINNMEFQNVGFINNIRIYIPFFVCIPFCFSYFSEYSSGCIFYITNRIDKRKYYVSKAIVCFFACFCILFIPLLLECIFNFTTFPINDNSNIGQFGNPTYGIEFYSNSYIVSFEQILYKNQFLFSILIALRFSSFWAVTSLFAYAISLFIKRYKIFILLPIFCLLYVFPTIQRLVFGENAGNVISYSLLDYRTISYNNVIIFYFGIIFLTLIFSIEFHTRKEMI